ncbi:TPA: hypothetical protein ACG0AS_003011 [Enterobacter hormaechei subsp. hoffmannii]|uniref:Lipoprotein n=8 Tax=Enterobacteriaceae TaxID=543 RepID=A0A6G6AQL5_KLUCR|nr:MULTISPECIES: hypothetical protein [Enterobacteriaceae]ASB76796.1 hypothetical protein AM429_23310 [Enterobacter cloacae complex sp.]EAB2318316.1 hypothetical protein [Salmonella enterica]EBR9914232.1 hypothetical protein [Salmonella enterica subsp. enterica serovar Virchow]EBS5296865.1 hypothetical protein [Salmonella enterica subsp. enterica serovar Infantis]EBV1651531.1 hypothetical protein [Salmonella enterica subsp. enterica serovar Bareilly]EBX4175828.1 hypothetical protein [Salmonel
MKHVLLPLITIPVLLLSACSSRPVSVADAKPAPQARVFKYQTSAPTTLVVMRDKGMIGAGCDASIFINGETVAKLETGEKATFHLDAGQWIVGASLEGTGLCALNPARQERETITKAGETKVFRVFTSNAGDIDILPTTL